MTMKGFGSRALTGLGLAAVFGLSLVSGARGLEPPSPGPADVVFSNGGRILSIKADGTGRKVIQGAELTAHNTSAGLTDPRVSPDGSKLVFVLEPVDNERGSDIWVSNADGSDPRMILDGNSTDHYLTPSWMPDSETLLVGHTRVKGQIYEAGIVSVKADGSGLADVLREPPRTADGKKVAGEVITRPVASPDGKQVLFLRSEWISRYEPGTYRGRLEVLDLAGGGRRLINAKSFGGSWSPDGDEVVFSKPVSDGLPVCSSDECVKSARMFISSLDGRQVRRVIPMAGLSEDDLGDERNPDWSADGSRIVFQSERNVVGEADAYEIYSVAADGTCLTWLTNGTPASITPSWASDPGETTVPSGCGSRDLMPTFELPDPTNGDGLSPHRYWLGRSIGTHVYSHRLDRVDETGARFSTLRYDDCAGYEPRTCGSGVTQFEYSVCAEEGSIFQSFLPDFIHFQKRRGVPALVYSDLDLDRAYLFTGTRVIGVAWSWLDHTLKRDQVIAALRPLEGGPNPRRFAPARFPASDIRRMKKVVRVVRRTGSAESAARKLSMSVRKVEANLRMSRALPKYGPLRTVKCPK